MCNGILWRNKTVPHYPTLFQNQRPIGTNSRHSRANACSCATVSEICTKFYGVISELVPNLLRTEFRQISHGPYFPIPGLSFSPLALFWCKVQTVHTVVHTVAVRVTARLSEVHWAWYAFSPPPPPPPTQVFPTFSRAG